MIFSNAILLIFLTLGLSSSIAHANQSQGYVYKNPASDLSGNRNGTSLASSNSSTAANGKGHEQSTTDKNGNNNNNDSKTGNTQAGKENDASNDCNKKSNVDAAAGKGNETSTDGNKKDNVDTGAAAAKKGNNTSIDGNKNNKVDVATGKGNDTSTDSNKKSGVNAAGKKNQVQDNGNGNGNKNNGNSSNPQTSLCLDPKVIGKGFAQNGQQNLTEPNQVASLTSTNNFINFCVGTNQQITNGKQIQSGSCNPIPMGSIPSTENMPTSRFQSPKNFDVVKAKTTFNVTMKIQGLTTGFFVNAESNYYSAPQQLDNGGHIIGHSHVVIQPMPSLDSTDILDAKTFAFFKGLNDAAENGILSAEVTGGLPSGAYRVASINTAANHQPCLAPVAQHGSLDDQAFFTVTDDGKPPATNPANDVANNGKGQTGNSTSKGANNGKGGNGTGNTSDKQSKIADNGKGGNGTDNTTGKQSSGKSQSQQSTKQQGKDNGNKGGDGTNDQQSTSSTTSGTGGKRRFFKLEIRKDGH